MSTITVLGLGAMGARMARRLLAAGHEVTVWNRTPQRAQDMAGHGARIADTPRQAVCDAEYVIAMVRDDAASRQLWLEQGVLESMPTGAVAIDSSTLSPDWVRELGAAADSAGVALLEAPVSGSRPQAESGQLVFFVGGDGAVCRKAEPILLAMGRAVHHVGPHGSAALTKLCTNALLGVQVVALAELIGLLQRSGQDVGSILAAIGTTAVWSPVAAGSSAGMLNGLASGSFAPMFPVELIEKDFGYALDAAGSPGLAPMIAAAGQVFAQAMRQGLGAENMTAVVRLFADRRSEA